MYILLCVLTSLVFIHLTFFILFLIFDFERCGKYFVFFLLSAFFLLLAWSEVGII